MAQSHGCVHHWEDHPSNHLVTGHPAVVIGDLRPTEPTANGKAGRRHNLGGRYPSSWGSVTNQLQSLCLTADGDFRY